MANEIEVWKDVPGFEGYTISEWGDIRDSEARLLPKSINGGYYRCRLVEDGSEVAQWFKVHRLVALAYLTRPEGSKKVVSLDENKLNTHVSNLSWYVKPEIIRTPRVEQVKEKKVKPYPKYKLQRIYKAISDIVVFCSVVWSERQEYRKPRTYDNCKRVMDLPWDIETKDSWNCYLKWCSMWYRVNNMTAYSDVSICDEWVHYSNFKTWWSENYIEGYQIDKDLLSPDGNRQYGPNTCCFLPGHLNTTLSGMNYTDRLTGVSLNKSGTYSATLKSCGKYKYLGSYKTEIEAHLIWISEKKKQIGIVADMYFLPEKSTNALIALMNKMDYCIQNQIPLKSYGSAEYIV